MDISIGDVISGIIIGSLATWFLIDYTEKESVSEITPLGLSGNTSSFTLKKDGNTYWCNAMSCWELTGFKNNSYDTEQGYPLYEYEE